MSDACVRSAPLMGTIVTIEIAGHEPADHSRLERDAAVERAFEWFRQIEASCNRFDASSEVRQLAAHPGIPAPVSYLLFEAVAFALALAEETDGAFDPTVGRRMEARGFNRDYRTGEMTSPALAAADVDSASDRASYRDVAIDRERRTVTLHRPLLLDLGAVAKGLAIDMAARELRPFVNFAIDAGGDLYLGGTTAHGAPWTVGIPHPRVDGELIETLSVSDAAVCTSGDYERRAAGDHAGHHILDARTGASATTLASVTVVAPTAMAADALATAAFALGPIDGIHLLEQQGVDGLFFTPALERLVTKGTRFAQVLPDA